MTGKSCSGPFRFGPSVCKQDQLIIESDSVLQIADGMDYLQRKGIVHMDLATRNVLLTHPDELAKVSDFGLSRVLCDDDEEMR